MDLDKQVKKYTYYEKKSISNKIDKLKQKSDCKKHLIKIGKIIAKTFDLNKITTKSNGLWLDFNLVDDATIYKVDKYLHKVFNEYDSIDSDSVEHSYKPYYIDPILVKCKNGPKFSNYEKNIIKRYRTYGKNTVETGKNVDSENNKSDKQQNVPSAI